MKAFGIEKKSSHYPILKATNVVFILLLGLAFSLFLFYHKISLFLFQKDKIDVFKEDLQQIAVYFLPIDRQVSHFLAILDNIIKGYTRGENILITQEKQIDEAWKYAKENKAYLKKLGFAGYEKIIDLIADLWKTKSEVFNLLGKKQSYNYLVILQNTNEKRPNGGFFGSFAFITVDQGHLVNLEIIDSYYPDFVAPKTRIEAPEWTSAFLPDRKIGYIAGNKFGFTDIDGKNLKELYEKMFNETYEMDKVKQTMHPDLYEKVLHKNIKGVFFIRSDTIENLVPGFREKIWEWQFLNASIDLLRGEVRGNKKELYIKEVKDFFAKNKGTLAKNVINNFEKLIQEQAINVWFSNISPELQQTLEKHHLINEFNTGFLYAWDTNISYNKVDGFVHKYIQIKNAEDEVVKESWTDIVDIKDLKPGLYHMEISYELKVPDQYRTFIESLEKKYGIKLTEREKGILALQSNKTDDPKWKDQAKRRESKSTLYFNKKVDITNIRGDMSDYKEFQAPFANGLFYQMMINTNNTKKSIQIDFEIKK